LEEFPLGHFLRLDHRVADRVDRRKILKNGLIIINSGGIEWNYLKSQKNYWLLKKRNN